MLEQTMTSPALPRSVFKTLIFVVVGGLAAFSLFAVMAHLAYNSNTSFVPPKENIIVEMLRAPEDTDTQIMKPNLPEPPAPPQQPPRPEPVNNTTTDNIGMGTLNIDATVGTLAIPGPDFTGPTEGDALPIVRVNPKYPIQAARDGIEGWVTLSFTIDEVGKVIDVGIMDANPKRVFDKEAKKALKKWKYKPKLQNGKAVKQPNQSVLLEFKLSQS